jgi:uncharacterized protein (TIGR02266 family)
MFDFKSWIRPSHREAAEMRAAENVEMARREAIAQDQRRQERVTLHAAVSVRSESNFFMGFSENISEGGVFVATLSPPPTGSRIDISVTVNDGDVMTVTGEVAWIRSDSAGHSTGCGVRFIDVTPKQTAALKQFVARASQEPLLYEV